MIEEKNSRVKTLKALVSRENHPRMMSTFRYWYTTAKDESTAFRYWHAAENILCDAF